MTPELDVLRAPDAGAKVIRGGAIRAGGYALTFGLAAITSVFLLRFLSVDDFGAYGVVAALLGIVASLTEGGLSVVGSRELATLTPGPARAQLLSTLLALRVVLTGVGVAGAAIFAVAAGYGSVVVLGTLLAGIGVILLSLQVTLSLPLRVELRLGAVTAVEVQNQAITCVLVAVLVAAGAPLLAFFGVQIGVGACAVLVTAGLVRTTLTRQLRVSWRAVGRLLRDALPVAAAAAMNVVYLRLLVVMVSLIATAHETGLFATSYRVFEMLVGLPTLVLAIALPLLAVHVRENRQRFGFGLQRLTEVALLAGLFQALLVAALAEPALVLLGGEKYRGASSILAVQGCALVPLYLNQSLTLGLIALRRQRELVIANTASLVVVVAAGVPLVFSHAGMGAAVAGLLTESVLAVALYAALVRGDRDVRPRLAFAWRPLAAAAAGCLPLVLVDVSRWIEAALAAVVFALVAVVVRAVPREVLPALRGGRRPRSRG